MAMYQDHDGTVEVNDQMIRINFRDVYLDMLVPFGVYCKSICNRDGCFCSVTIISSCFLESLELVVVTVDH